MYKEDLALNNLQRLICNKTQANSTKPIFIEQWRYELTQSLGDKRFHAVPKIINQKGTK